MGYYLASLLDFTGLEYISAGLERLILFLYPTIVILLTAFIYRRPVSKPQRWALLLSYTGILLVFGSSSDAAYPDIMLGAVLVFASAVVFALFMTGSGHFIPRFGSRRFTAYSMSVACVATGAHFPASKPMDQLMVSSDVFGLALMLALFSTVVPAFLMNAGIHHRRGSSLHRQYRRPGRNPRLGLRAAGRDPRATPDHRIGYGTGRGTSCQPGKMETRI